MMAKIKIILEKGESEFEAEDALLKALNHQRSGDNHINESFEDPAMIDATKKMADLYKSISDDMMAEIERELDKEIK